MATPLDQFNTADANDDIDELINIASLGIMYSGFNPVRTRQEMFEKNIKLKDLVVMLTALAISGNNPERLTSVNKITDATIGQAVAAVAKRYNIIGTKKRSNATVTFARLGAAFMPVYLYVRQWCIQHDRLQEQFPDTIDLLFQDPMLGGFAEQKGKIELYRKYYAAFSLALTPTRPATTVVNMTDWVGIQVQGFKRDLSVKRYCASVANDAELAELRRVTDWFNDEMHMWATTSGVMRPLGTSVPTGSGIATSTPGSKQSSKTIPASAPATTAPAPSQVKAAPAPGPTP